LYEKSNSPRLGGRAVRRNAAPRLRYLNLQSIDGGKMNKYFCESQRNRVSGIFVPLISMVLLASCAQNGSFPISAAQTSLGNTSSSLGGSSVSATPTPSPVSNYQPQPLSWESSAHPERAAWSTALYQIVSNSFSTLTQATDLTFFCPKYASLTQDQQINLIADIFASDSYYECSWDPTEYSVDVGTANDNSTWSVGLLQMSVVDQQNYGFTFGYTFADLQTPTDNLVLGVAVMAHQISRYGTILIPKGSPGLYWSTMNPGGKDDHSANIAAMTKQLSFCN